MSFEVNDLVRFCQGDEDRTLLLGRVTRAPWGRSKQNVSIRTLQADRMTGAIYVRLTASVELIEKAGGDGHYEVTYRTTP